MKLYACCPICGHKLLKGENGTFVELRCPRCSNFVRITIKEQQVSVVLFENSKNKSED